LSFNATFSSGKEKKDVFWWLEVWGTIAPTSSSYGSVGGFPCLSLRRRYGLSVCWFESHTRWGMRVVCIWTNSLVDENIYKIIFLVRAGEWTRDLFVHSFIFPCLTSELQWLPFTAITYYTKLTCFSNFKTSALV
jgi:hypothetical protein